MGNQKLKAVFILSILIYCTVGFYGDHHYAYVDETSMDEAMSKYIWLIILVSIAMGITVFILFKKLFPVGYKKQSSVGLIAILFTFMVLPVSINIGYTVLINGIYLKDTVMITGLVKEKYFTKGSKGWKTYYIVVEDASEERVFKFEVRRYVYDRMPDSEAPFNKEFQIGALGILYRKEF